MSLDLKKVYDHPAIVLEKALADWDYVPSQGPSRFLRRYEEENDVTFAALDNVTLAAVQESYNHFDHDDFISAVRDLLGLEEED